jgi:hypothetical protein
MLASVSSFLIVTQQYTYAVTSRPNYFIDGAQQTVCRRLAAGKYSFSMAVSMVNRQGDDGARGWAQRREKPTRHVLTSHFPLAVRPMCYGTI